MNLKTVNQPVMNAERPRQPFQKIVLNPKSFNELEQVVCNYYFVIQMTFF